MEDGLCFIDWHGSVLRLGPQHPEPSAYGVFVGGESTGGPKSAEPAEPAKPSPLAGKVAEMRKEVVDLEQAAGLGWPPQRSIITSILAIARVVEALAKEAKR